jgi:translation elongation factor EF-Ts
MPRIEELESVVCVTFRHKDKEFGYFVEVSSDEEHNRKMLRHLAMGVAYTISQEMGLDLTKMNPIKEV